MVCSNERDPASDDVYPGFVPLRDALPTIGITAPTFYRWIRTGRIDDCRMRGRRGRTFLSIDAIEDLRRTATRVDYAT